eukprot:TRINITY_DN43921_c0_g1_i1.p1 TRINITY_DN43921_c0_g1~~TRINITY_DN43921_c0_g1_i1.p1  ORF type:complete len:177 (-),score=30.70 TRINITY_DN43921_c0_g1_i1:98-628(-)
MKEGFLAALMFICRPANDALGSFLHGMDDLQGIGFNPKHECLGACDGAACSDCIDMARIQAFFVPEDGCVGCRDKENKNNEAVGHSLDGAESDRRAEEVCACEIKGEQCQCSYACDQETSNEVCTELLGPCTCSEEDTCACTGYCHTQFHREEACVLVPGCEWTGMWCQQVIGLMW